MPILEYVVLAVLFITVLVIFSMVIMLYVEDFFRSRRTKVTHPHHIHHKHHSERNEYLPVRNYIYSLLHKKRTPAYIKRQLLEKGWTEHEAHDAVRHYTELYLQDKSKSKGKRFVRPKVLFRVKE